MYSVTLATYQVTGVTVGSGGITVAGLTAIRQEGLPVALRTRITVGSVEVRTAETLASHGVTSLRNRPVERTGTFWTEVSSSHEDSCYRTCFCG